MRPLIECDLECYPDYFLCKFHDEKTGLFHSYGMWDGQPLDRERIIGVLKTVTIVTFNGEGYDVPMLVLALHGATCAQLKQANDDIIVRGLRPWQFYKQWGIERPDYIDNIDIMEVAPGVRLNLKMYMGRLHAPRMQDLPYDPSTALDAVGRFVINDYCGNDLIGTKLLRQEVWKRIALRIDLTKRYGIDLRSKSDAQIAEAVIKSQLSFDPVKRYVPHNFQFYYEPPAYLQFISPAMNELLQMLRTAPFVVTDKEEALEIFGESTGIKTGVQIPPAIKGRDIAIGQGVYRIGIGGLHSQEKSVNHYAVPGVNTLRDVDVKSYYPSLILTMGMVPEQLGPAFLTIFNAIYTQRLFSKSEAERLVALWNAMGAEELRVEAADHQNVSDGFKIVLNGTFGKLFSKYSILYAPELGIRTTITGQLALLMLIEMFEYSGIRVVSANTDGIVLSIPAGLETIADNIVQWWEQRTGLEMEATNYKSLHSRDVNNYVAITTDGKAKRKGVFSQGGVLSGPAGKGPNMDICADAVVAYLKDGTPILDTIRNCTDIRKFIVLRGVKGGGIWVPPNLPGYDSKYLGKAVRWYYGGHKSAYIAYESNGNKVATSDGATEVMDLPDTLPTDIDYMKYHDVAMLMLADVGLPVQYWWHESTQDVQVRHPEEFNPLHPTVFGWTEIDRKTYDKRK